MSENGFHINRFPVDGERKAVSFVETVAINEEVRCHVYKFDNENGMDLGIIEIGQGGSTPLQEVISGVKTTEGFLAGKGKLIIYRQNGQTDIYPVNNDNYENILTDVCIGDLMQWHADSDSFLKVFEICVPPFEDGRFRNITK